MTTNLRPEKYEYTAHIETVSIGSRISPRKYEYVVGCLRGPKFIEHKLAQLKVEIANIEAKMALITESHKDWMWLSSWHRNAKDSYERHQNDGPYWVIAGYCGNMNLAMKLRDKEARVVNGLSWDDVRIVPLSVRAIKTRAKGTQS